MKITWDGPRPPAPPRTTVSPASSHFSFPSYFYAVVILPQTAPSDADPRPSKSRIFPITRTSINSTTKWSLIPYLIARTKYFDASRAYPHTSTLVGVPLHKRVPPDPVSISSLPWPPIRSPRLFTHTRLISCFMFTPVAPFTADLQPQLLIWTWRPLVQSGRTLITPHHTLVKPKKASSLLLPRLGQFRHESTARA